MRHGDDLDPIRTVEFSLLTFILWFVCFWIALVFGLVYILSA